MFRMDTFEIRLMCVSMKRRLLFIATGASTDDDASSSYSLMIAASKAEGGEMDVTDTGPQQHVSFSVSKSMYF